MKYVKYIKTKIGEITIIEENEKITRIDICKKYKNDATYCIKDTVLLSRTAKQLEEYFQGKRKNFNIPIKQKGTPFQQRVWKALQEIPYGEVTTYGEIAEKIGSPKAARAVGMANHNNNIPIIIPCHRVIGANGKLVGYALGLEMKQWLLNLEKENK